jgi:hypothetical protein
VWYSVASAADGSKLAASGAGGSGNVGNSNLRISTSPNSGVSWFESSASYYERSALGCSADGTKLVIAVQFDGIYTSTDSAVTWTQTSAPVPIPWWCVASSADGTKLVAATRTWQNVALGSIYISTDSGENWIQASAPDTNWSSVASSADGNKLVAVVAGGGIYTWQAVSPPELNITLSEENILLYWTASSTNFALQQSLNLSTTNWTDVTNTTTLTNGQYQVTPPPSGNSSFYRLVSP